MFQTKFEWLDGKIKVGCIDAGSAGGETLGYYESGKLRFQYPTLNGKLHGIGRIWDEDGRLLSEETYKQGVLNGLKREWYLSGTLKTEHHYGDGRYHGEQREWYENGQLKYYYTCIRDPMQWRVLLHGVKREYYPSGRIQSQGAYLFGSRHGIFRTWDEKGNVIEVKMYIKSVAVSGEINDLIKADKITAQHVLKAQNASVRRIYLEDLGCERFMSQLGGKVIDEDSDYELIRIEWHKREEPIFLVKVKCPSTGAFYTLRVPPDMKTVKEAIAWTFGLQREEYHPELET